MNLDLGAYVCCHLRRDGTFRVFFEVPQRLRPDGWLPTIPLPQIARTGNLNDPDECARIREEAASLNLELRRRRANKKSLPEPNTWRALIASWNDTTNYKALAAATKVYYDIYAERLARYFESHPEFQPSTITESGVEIMLSNWNHSPDMKIHARTIMDILMKKAIKEKWRSDNPVSDIICPVPKRPILIWESEDVDHLSEACLAANEAGIAAIIQTVWELGQRLTDTRSFRHGVEYVDGVFRFFQSKTSQYVSIPAPSRLIELLDCNAKEGAYLFISSQTGLPFTEIELGMRFRQIRERLPEYRDRPIRLRNLRHSCIVQLARAGCEIFEIASVTGHSYATVHKIIEHYLPRDNILALMAIEKRNRMILGAKPNVELSAPSAAFGGRVTVTSALHASRR